MCEVLCWDIGEVPRWPWKPLLDPVEGPREELVKLDIVAAGYAGRIL